MLQLPSPTSATAARMGHPPRPRCSKLTNQATFGNAPRHPTEEVQSRLDCAYYILVSVGNHQVAGLKHGIDKLCPTGAIIASLLER
jgi:hypothetical protein